MAFGTITIGANVFNSIGAGLYQLSTVGFGQPSNQVKVSGGKTGRFPNSSPVYNQTYASVTRKLEKDIVLGTVTQRRLATVSLSFTIPEGFTTTEVDNLVADMSTWVDSTTLTRLLMGES